jgi:predicted permease
MMSATTALPTTGFRAASLLEALVRDLRRIFRSLRQKPGFTIVVVLSLALGIGANTAIFSLVDAILLRPLPVPNSDGLISVDVAASRLSQFGSASYLDLKDFNSRSRAFKSLEISQGMSAGMSTGHGQPQIVWGLLVSGSFFSTMQVQPALGRDFRPVEDEVPGKYPVAIISYSLWGRAFANDQNVIGRQVTLNNKSFTIVGVAPKSFTGADLFYRPDIYVPTMMTQGLTTDGNEMLTHRSFRGFNMMGRLKPGVTVAQAQAEMDGIVRDLERTYPDTNKDTVVYVRNEMKRRLAGGAALPSVLMGLVILVLVIACANVANLLMARATSRMRELSTQLAVGASRGTLVRQLLTESAVLAFLGGTFGVFLGLACIRGFTAFLPYSAAPANPDFHLDLRVLTFALGASTLAVFLCGLAPAFLTVNEAMAKITSNVRIGSSAGRAYGAVARRTLIAGQIALSTLLLICGGLFLKTFSRAEKMNLGFNPDHVLLVVLDPSLRGYSNEKARVLQEQLVQRVAALPGVTASSVASSVPFLSGNSWDISIDGYTAPGGEKFVDTNTNQVGPRYFATMQIPVLRGREFTDHDNDGSPLVVIVNETLARRYIVGEAETVEKAIGHHIQLRDRGPITIVGVVKDSNAGRIGDPPQPVFYMSYAQMGRPEATLHVRTKGDPSAITSLLLDQLRSIDPDIAPISVLTFETAVSSQGLFLPRIAAILGAAFGMIALSLSVVGIYGIVSFMVGRRTQEIGVRIALGAQRGQILRMVLANGAVLTAIGLAIGTMGAFALTPLLGGVLLDVNPRDPGIFFSIASVLVAAALAASWIPARRATRIDPMEALRYE